MAIPRNLANFAPKLDSSGNPTFTAPTVFSAGDASLPSITFTGDTNTGIFSPAADTIAFSEGGVEAMRIDSSGRLLYNTTSSASNMWFNGESITPSVQVVTNSQNAFSGMSIINYSAAAYGGTLSLGVSQSDTKGTNALTTNTGPVGNINFMGNDGTNFRTCAFIRASIDGTSGSGDMPGRLIFGTTADGSTNGVERVRIDASGTFLIGKTDVTLSTAGFYSYSYGEVGITRNASTVLLINRTSNDGNLVEFYQENTLEGTISVSGNTVSYNGFSGGHWTQLQQGRGYNPEILRGTVMSTIGEMSEWKSVEWTETIDHLATEEKEAWTETKLHRKAYFGQLPVGATFEEDGVTKTVVDDGNERLPKVKISDVVGDKAVYGVFMTWDEAQDMLVTSLGAFVVRIAAGVTVQIGDLLESNGDGCAKVQDDDIIRSKTIGKVTSTTATATYDDGSYTVPCVIYCG